MPGYDVSGALPEKLLCTSCKLLLRDPVQTDKGVHYCLDCLPQECCADGKSGMQAAAQKGTWHRDMGVKKEVMELKVKCSNAVHGCKWQDRVRNLEDHLDGCPHQTAELHTSKRVEEKLRKFERGFEEFVHGMRSMLGSMKDMTAAFAQQISTLRSELDTSQNSRSSVHGLHDTHSQPLPFEAPIANEDLVTLALRLAEEAQEQQDMLRQDDNEDSVLDSSPEQQDMLRQDDNKESVLDDSPLPKASAVPDPDPELPEDDNIEQIFKKGIKEGRAGLAQARENERDLEQHGIQGDGVKKKMGSLSTAALSMRGPFMSGKDSSAMKVPPYPMGSIGPTSYNGRFTWKISGVARKRREALANPSTPLTSPPWYTAPDGYQLCTHLYLSGNGTGLGTHVSIFLSVMKGEFDRILLWPLKCRMSFSLLDLEQRRFPIVQTLHSNPNSSSFQRPPPQSAMNIASGCPDFAPLSILDDKRYVDDDEMYIKCIMDVHS